MEWVDSSTVQEQREPKRYIPPTLFPVNGDVNKIYSLSAGGQACQVLPTESQC